MNSQPLQAILNPDPATVAGETPIAVVLASMERRGISCLLAVDAERRPTGIFTERDAVRLMATGKCLDMVTMADVMRHPVFTVAADLDTRDAYRRMSGRGYRHLVVVDGEGRLVGIVGEGDFMRHLGMEYLVELKTVASAMTPDPVSLSEDAGSECVAAAARDMSSAREQDAQLQLQIHALNAAGNAIVITDTVPRILWANAAFTTLTGYSLAEAIGRKPAELVKSGEQDQPYYQRMWASILAGQVWHGELVNKRKDGSLYHEDLTITPVAIDGKATSHFVAIKQDISARKTAEAALRQSEQRLRLALQGANAGIWEWNIRSQAVHWSDENYRVLGLPLPGEGGEPGSYERWLHSIPPEDRARVQAQVEEAVTHSSDLDIEFRVVWPDGSVHWINDRGQFLLDAQGRAESMVGIQLDITARKTAELALSESEERFRLLYERAPVAYQSLDLQGRILEVNAAWLVQLGYPPEAVIGRPFREFLAPGQENLLQERFCQFLATGEVRGADFDIVSKDGDILVFEVEGRIGRDAEGRFSQTHCVLHNITERKALERRLAHLAATDALTGLANRRHFLDQMTLALARQKRHDTPTALLMLDLDWFKTVNDRYGHATGDEVLRHSSAVMASSLRRIDLIGRLGGEEFAILLPDTEAGGAHEFAERLRQLVASQPACAGSSDIPVTLSIGVTLFASNDGDIDAILARADRALYRAKENGRNRVELEPLP